MNPDLDTLVTAPYVRIDDLLAANPQWVPLRPDNGARAEAVPGRPGRVPVNWVVGGPLSQ